MTIAALIKRLESLRAEHGNGVNVTVEWETFQHGDWSHVSVERAEPEFIGVMDDDGYFVQNADGSERQRVVIALKGRFQ